MRTYRSFTIDGRPTVTGPATQESQEFEQAVHEKLVELERSDVGAIFTMVPHYVIHVIPAPESCAQRNAHAGGYFAGATGLGLVQFTPGCWRPGEATSTLLHEIVHALRYAAQGRFSMESVEGYHAIGSRTGAPIEEFFAITITNIYAAASGYLMRVGYDLMDPLYIELIDRAWPPQGRTEGRHARQSYFTSEGYLPGLPSRADLQWFSTVFARGHDQRLRSFSANHAMLFRLVEQVAALSWSDAPFNPFRALGDLGTPPRTDLPESPQGRPIQERQIQVPEL